MFSSVKKLLLQLLSQAIQEDLMQALYNQGSQLTMRNSGGPDHSAWMVAK